MYQVNGVTLDKDCIYFFNKNEFGMKYFVIFMKHSYNCLNKPKKNHCYLYNIQVFKSVQIS
jgi:hypothetical protein